ncbi:MAG: hypothetical protein II750_06435 [Bacteroidaceae bacterium]|nr:hypothetical protein [Bacteroidaceae bacterium]
MKKSTWLPPALLLAGIAFYVNYGIEYNAWVENLPLIIIDLLICVALFFALRKKESLSRERQSKK